MLSSVFSFSEMRIFYYSEVGLLFCSIVSSRINERDDEVPTTTAVTFSINNSQPFSRRTRLLKVDNQNGSYGDGSYRPSSVDGR